MGRIEREDRRRRGAPAPHQPSAQMGPPWAAERKALFHLHDGPPAVWNWPAREGWLGALCTQVTLSGFPHLTQTVYTSPHASTSV